MLRDMLANEKDKKGLDFGNREEQRHVFAPTDSFVISSEVESSARGRFCGVEKPVFRCGSLESSAPGRLPNPATIR